eukprot:1672236-Amphidinium_carterae.1
MLNQARANADAGGTQVPQIAKAAFKPAPLSKDNSPETQRAWQEYYACLERRTEAARKAAAQSQSSSSGTHMPSYPPVPSSAAASAETENQAGGGTQSRTSGSNKIPSSQPPRYEPLPPATDTPMEHVLTTRELQVVVDIGMLLQQTSVDHQTYHPMYTDPQALHVHNQLMFDTHYPGIR